MKAQERNSIQRVLRGGEVHRICTAYELMYREVYGRDVTVEYKNGWYIVGGHKFREDAILRDITVHYAKQHAEEVEDGSR